MLPSVSAGSAALTKYAQAVAIAASEDTHRDSDATPRPEQEAARQNAEKQPVPAQAQDTLARDARATVEAVLELLRVRVLTALLGLGASEEVANRAANAATSQLASAFAGESRHAAEIVHALLEQLQSSAGARPEQLLQFAARGLVVIIDHVSGDVRVTTPQFDLSRTAEAPQPAAAPHLLDFTDYSANKAAPVLQALGAVHAAANAAIDKTAIEPTTPLPATPPPSAFVVAPDAFVQPLATQLVKVLPANTVFTADEAAKTISRMFAQAIAGAISSGSANITPPVGEIMQAARQLQPVAAVKAGAGTAETANTARIELAAGKISVSLETDSGAITVKIGDRTTVFAPVSTPATGSPLAPLPGLNGVALPEPETRPLLPAVQASEKPAAVPFVPPAFDAPPPVAPQAPEQRPANPSAAAPNGKAVFHNAAGTDETLRHIDPAVMRNATVLRSLGPVAGTDVPSLTRIALDIAGEIAPGAPVAINSPKIGKFGLPKPAPVQSENGPVLKHGYADASANLPPVLPAVHMRAHTDPEERKAKPKPKQAQKRLAAGKYENLAIEDAFTREMPAEHQGLVFSSVVFSV